jgi:hypothetical protein
MKNFLLFVCVAALYCNTLFAQTKFQKGYFIDNNNVRTECLIKNDDWLNNPSKFSYKVSETAPIQSAEMPVVKEFGIYNNSKFVRADVNIDLTTNDYSNNLGNDKNPEWHQQQLFLKVLIEGKASLYYYKGQNVERFFYSVNAGDSINP